MLRRIPLGEMNNLRDLGGYPTGDGRVTVWERFLRGDNPTGLSQRDLDWLLERGITTVVDLRSGEEVERKPDQLSSCPGFDYHHIGLVGGDVLPNLEADIGRAYFGTLERKISMCQVLRIMAKAPGGTLFHCTAGKDRTGMTAMLLLALAGVGREDILADYQVSETYLYEIIRHIRAMVPDLAPFAGASKSGYMAECMDLLLAKYGGVPAYLRAIGLTDGEMDALRAKLLD